MGNHLLKDLVRANRNLFFSKFYLYSKRKHKVIAKSAKTGRVVNTNGGKSIILTNQKHI